MAWRKQRVLVMGSMGQQQHHHMQLQAGPSRFLVQGGAVPMALSFLHRRLQKFWRQMKQVSQSPCVGLQWLTQVPM